MGFISILTASLFLSIAAGASDDDCKPSQIHIAGGRDPTTEMTISWVTKSQCSPSRVKFGTNSKKLSSVAGSDDPPLQYNQYTRKLGNYTSPFIHHVTIQKLSSNQKYFYDIIDGSGGDKGSGDPYSFTTAPNAGSYPLKFGVVGDLGQTGDSKLTARHMETQGLRAILHAGDMAYADCYHPRWDSWFELVQPLAATTPWYVVVGNHEIEHNMESGELFLAYESRFKMPAVKPAVREKMSHYTSCSPR